MELEEKKSEGVSVFLPAYHDAPSLPGLVSKTFAVLCANVADFEVLLISDGRRHSTREVLTELQQRYGFRLRVVTDRKSRGYAWLLHSGLAAASKDLIFYTDGDTQYDMADLTKLLAEMQPGVGLVNGYKLEHNDGPPRGWIGNFYNRVARSLFGVQIQDVDCDFRLFRRSLAEKLNLFSTSSTIWVELVRKLELSGYRVVEVGVHHHPGRSGHSQFFRVRSLAKTLYELFKLWVSLGLLFCVLQQVGLLECLYRR